MTKTVLSIAGSDSSGGAGIQADIKTCCAFKIFATTAITAITAQNTMGVHGFVTTSPEMIRDQIDAVVEDIRPDAVKIGMLGNAAAARAVAESLMRHRLDNVVLDPVMVASAGNSLSQDSRSLVEVIMTDLMPCVTLLTPNLPEARTLLGLLDSETDQLQLAEMLSERTGGKNILVKGGHSFDIKASDVLITNAGGSMKAQTFTNDRVVTSNNHGTGCTLSSAIACCLARGLDLSAAVATAKQYVYEALRSGVSHKLGKGHGPLDFDVQVRNLV